MLQKARVKTSKTNAQIIACFATKGYTQYDVVLNPKLWFGSLGKAHSIKDGKVNPCGLDGCDSKYNQHYLKIDPEEDQYIKNQPTLVLYHPVVACY